METDEIVKIRIERVVPLLNERQRRIYLGAELKALAGEV